MNTMMLIPLIVLTLATLLESASRFPELTESEKLKCSNGFMNNLNLQNIHGFAQKSTFNERPATEKELLLNHQNHHKTDDEISVIDDWLGKGWIGVPFGSDGEMAHRIFQIVSNRATFINVVDIFCTGDRFRVEAEPMDGNSASVIMFTSTVATNNCSSSTRNPDEAWSSEAWSTGQMMVPPGSYWVKIYVEYTPYYGGTLAIRADHPFCFPPPA